MCNGVTTTIIFIVCGIIVLLFMDRIWNIRLIATNILASVICYLWSFISTKWVITKYENEIIKHNKHNQYNEKYLGLEQVLSTKDGFKLFANHLVQEFSIEHLFFLFEMMQIKNKLIATELCT